MCSLGYFLKIPQSGGRSAIPSSRLSRSAGERYRRA
jgi:hypothetical protein